jgi:hypothetical protein
MRREANTADSTYLNIQSLAMSSRSFIKILLTKEPRRHDSIIVDTVECRDRRCAVQ